jgi:cytochrome c-type biogenesis protein CcmH/NrfG
MQTHCCHASAKEVALFEEYEKRLEKNPNDVDALIQIGFLCIEPFHDDEEFGFDCLERAVELEPANMQAQLWFARALYHTQCAYEDAKIALENALQIDPNNAECCDLLASVLQSLGEDENLSKSITLLQRAITTQPGWPLLRFRLANHFLKRGQLDEAEKEILEIKEILKNTILSPPKTPMEEYVARCMTGLKPEALQRVEEFLTDIAKQRAAARPSKE